MKFHRFPQNSSLRNSWHIATPPGFPAHKFRTDDVSLPRSGWLLIGRAGWGIYFNQSKSTTQIRLVLVSQTPFCRERSDGVAKCWLFNNIVHCTENIPQHLFQWAWKLVTVHCMFSSRFLLHWSEKNTWKHTTCIRNCTYSETSIKRTPLGPS